MTSLKCCLGSQLARFWSKAAVVIFRPLFIVLLCSARKGDWERMKLCFIFTWEQCSHSLFCRKHVKDCLSQRFWMGALWSCFHEHSNYPTHLFPMDPLLHIYLFLFDLLSALLLLFNVYILFSLKLSMFH